MARLGSFNVLTPPLSLHWIKILQSKEEKNSNIFYQLEQLERRLEELERTSEKSSDNTRQFVEKIVMLIIGGLVTWLFNVLQK